ncbi:HDOD domain-containing protein [Teredinibacter waterburyi]|uniref:HDOD domain-containing protein n=1 Tax=Teredinibacter waterburyi TaxID=1500538 RepID=UPI001FE35610|nr:HDOD domain-containing protein [Teredinibacter waterburyi]
MSTKGLSAWATKLRSQNMPVLGDVIAELNKITGSDDADVNQLAEVILRDPHLTTHVLRIANSVQYNYSKVLINTVSRAIVLIGLKGVRAMCISLLVMDSLLTDQPKERLLALVAQGFHAATQARNLAQRIDDKAGEEVFVAALLFNLGEMAFWASEDVVADNANLLSDDAKVRRSAMEEVLGTSFKAITRELAKHWKLGDTLEQALYPTHHSSLKVKAVVAGERLSRAALYGWESPQVRKVLKEVIEYTGQAEDEALEMVRQGADQAAQVALNYGVAQACPLIPSSTRLHTELPKTPASRILKGDPKLQLSILRELGTATQDRLDVNTIFQMVLEGMHRGIGLERVCLAFIDRHKLKAKYALGDSTEHWRSRFVFDIGPYSENLFTKAIQTGGAHWFNSEEITRDSSLYSAEIIPILGRFPAFTSVLQLDQRKVALFYADRWSFGGKLDEDQFESFKHFASQAEYSLRVLTKKP